MTIETKKPEHWPVKPVCRESDQNRTQKSFYVPVVDFLPWEFQRVPEDFDFVVHYPWVDYSEEIQKTIHSLLSTKQL